LDEILNIDLIFLPGSCSRSLSICSQAGRSSRREYPRASTEQGFDAEAVLPLNNPFDFPEFY